MNTVLKKLLLLVGCCACLFFGMNAYAEMYEANTTEIESQNVFRYVANSDAVFIQDGSEIRRYSAETLDLISSTTVPYDILHIAAGNDGLYINDAGHIALINENGERVSEWDLPSEFGDEAYQFYVTDQYIVLLESVKESQFIENGTNLWYIDKNTNECLRSQCAIGVFAVSNMEDGRMLLIQTESWQYALNAWDPATDTIENMMYMTSQPDIILADGLNGVYCFSNDRVYYMDFEKGERLDVCRIGEETAAKCAGLERSGERMFTEDTENHRLIVLKLMKNSEQAVTLNLINLSAFEDRLGQAIDLFAEKYPNVYVKFTDMTDDKLNTLLLAQDPSIDILPVSSYTIDAYMENGVLADLTQCDEIRENLKNWRDFNGMLSADASVYVLPIWVNADSLSGDTAILNDCGVDTEQLDLSKMTWEEFYDFCAQLMKDYGVIAYGESSRFPVPVKQYIATFNGKTDEIVFQTDEFYAIVELLKKTKDEGIVPFTKMPLTEDYVFDNVGVVGASRWEYATEQAYLLPSAGETYATPVLMDMIGVNVRGENRELALEFLSILTSIEVQSKEYLAAMLNDAALYDVEFMKENNYEITEMSLRVWDQSSSTLGSTGLIQGEFGKYLGDQMESYLDGQMDAVTLAKSLDERVRMILIG